MFVDSSLVKSKLAIVSKPITGDSLLELKVFIILAQLQRGACTLYHFPFEINVKN